MSKRKIVQIDEEKCNGCGLCVPSCAEGAIQIIDGKARLVAEIYCDGLGACLGECPQGAITIIEREADPFDEKAAAQQAARVRDTSLPVLDGSAAPPSGCPGSTSRTLHPQATTQAASPSEGRGVSSTSGGTTTAETPSALGNWPIQLNLVPPNAPFLENAHLLLVADCVPFALADFHRRFLAGRPVVIGCPKLDDSNRYIEKLAAILTASKIKSLTVVHMEVPCCTGLVRIAQTALRMCGKETPLSDITISLQGRVIDAP